MNLSLTARFIFASALVVTFSAAAQAQATRTWVSGVGDDANPCSRTAPCKTFAGAMSKTAAGGEINALDPGGYGPVSINKSLTINGADTMAGILASVSAPNGVIVNAGPNDTVILRNLSINGSGTASNGIRYLGGATLTVDNCRIYGFNGTATARGIDVSLAGNGSLQLINTLIEDVTEDGIRVTTSNGIVVLTIENSQIMDCGGDGIEAVNNARGSIIHSRIVFCDRNGVLTSGANTQLNVHDSLISNCDITGLRAGPGSSIRAADSVIANNSTGLAPNGGTIESFQGNSLIGNPVQGAFTSTTAKQ